MPMKKKQLIIISAVILAVLVVVFAVFAANGSARKAQQNTTVSTSASTQAQQTTAPTETQETETQTQETTAAEKKNDIKDNTTQKQQAATAEKTTQAEWETEKQSVTVTIEITCKNALAYESTTQKEEELNLNLPKSGYIVEKTSLTLEKGATVFDALSSVCSSNGVSLKYQSKSYIQAIGGLAEKDCGGSSGWMYRVNGETPNKGASKYTLSDGDRIEWYYVTNSSDR